MKVTFHKRSSMNFETVWGLKLMTVVAHILRHPKFADASTKIVIESQIKSIKK